MVKIEIFTLYIGHSCTTLWVKNSLETDLSLTVFEIFTLFHFLQTSKMARQKWRKLKFEIEIFSPYMYRIHLYYPVGQTFARNRPISYSFRDIHTFSFSDKIQDGRKKGAKIEIFPLCIGYSCTTLGSKIHSKSLSRTVFEKFTLFHFPLKSKMATKSGEH